MIALLCTLFVALVVCFVIIYRASQENYDLTLRVKEHETQRHYLQRRNRDLNAELLMLSVHTTNTRTTSTSAPLTIDLPAEHPQKRRPQSIRGKKK